MEFKLRNGQIVLLDMEDAINYVGIPLFISTHGYLKCPAKGKKEHYVHREIMKAQKPQYVDHINGNKLDNRKVNLRICTNAQNSFNARTRSNNVSGIRGVYYDKARCLWTSQIKSDNKVKFLGRFTTIEEAAEARKKAELIYHGEFAAINGVSNEKNKERINSHE